MASQNSGLGKEKKKNSVQTPLSHPPPQLTDSLNSLSLSLSLSLSTHLLPMSLVTMIVLLCSNWLFSGCISGHASCSRVGKSAEKEKSLTLKPGGLGGEVWGGGLGGMRSGLTCYTVHMHALQGILEVRYGSQQLLQQTAILLVALLLYSGIYRYMYIIV